jgi:uncharacterized protein (TIGR03118 family)
MLRMRKFLPRFILGSAGLLCLLALPFSASAQRYDQTNLVSDLTGMAKNTDPLLVNPWGVTFSKGGPIWLSDNNSGFSTVYNGSGVPYPVGNPYQVAIPLPTGIQPPPPAAPTGIALNSTTGFVITEGSHSGPAMFIFDTEDGTISGWNLGVDFKHAVLVVDNSKPGGVDHSMLGAVYKGLAIATITVNKVKETFIFATNFRDGVIEEYDSKFNFIKSFTTTKVPAGYAPFGIQLIKNQLYVTYAKQDAAKHDSVAGPGFGYLATFSPVTGKVIKLAISQGNLNAPWGMTIAPGTGKFGMFSGDLLVGNFGDGHINAYSPTTFALIGQLEDSTGAPLFIDGLWNLTFGSGGLNVPTTTLLFTAGIMGEQHGLMGTLVPAP